MKILPQNNKASQTSFTVHRFNPATGTSRVISIENRSGFKHLRKPELTDQDRKTIEEIRERGKNLDPETLKSIINRFIEDKLRRWKPGSEGQRAESQGDVGVSEPGSERIPGREGKKGVAPGPKKPAKVRRLNVPPVYLVKYYRKEEPSLGWEVPLRGMYLVSNWDAVKKQRIFNKGVEWLAMWCGLSERQVRRILARMKVRRVEGKKGSSVKGIIKLRGRGWPGEGCSRWELPCNMGLVMRWRRHLPKK